MLRHPEVIDFQIDDPRWRHVPHICARLEQAAVLTLRHLPKAYHFPAKVTLLLTKDAHIQRLNHDFRGIDQPTNVLSFPQFHPDEVLKMGKVHAPIHVGDIAVSYQYVVAEAKRDHKELINHVVHMLVHGILHLFGYDHIDDKSANRMERLEKKVMAELNLPDPYVIIEKSVVDKKIKLDKRKVVVRRTTPATKAVKAAPAAKTVRKAKTAPRTRP